VILLKKALRGIWRNKRAYIACILLQALGIAVFIAFRMLYINLQAARDTMYETQRFADVFASVVSVSAAEVRSLEAVEGIARVDARLVADARVIMEELPGKIITLKLHSYDPAKEQPLNAFLLVSDTPAAGRELLVGDAFSQAHGLLPGDPLTLVLEGRQLTWEMAGAVQSPDYIYTISDVSQLLPDTSTFGIGYLPYDTLSAFTGKTGLYNQLSFLLEEGYDFDDVKYRLEDLLVPYGLDSLFERKDQPSNAMLSTEIDSTGAMATAIPMIFIAMAVIILYIMLKRIVEQERMQIGTLKAFGFSDSSIVLHYLVYGVLIGGLGGILGILAGGAMAAAMSEMYMVYFFMPSISAPLSPGLVAVGFCIALGSGALGAFMGSRSILRLLPGTAMRPPAPRIVKYDILARLPLLKRMLVYNGQMAVRNVSRSRFRSLFVAVGVAFSFSIIAFTSSYGDMMDTLTVDQFTKVQRYDLKVTLSHPTGYRNAVEAAYGMEEVRLAEAILEVPVQLRMRNLREDAVITAMAGDSSLYRIYDNQEDLTLAPPVGGAVLSRSLADKLGAKRGDILLAKTPYTGEREVPLPVMDIVQVNMGSAAYIELAGFCRLLEVPASANSVLVKTYNPEAVMRNLAEAENVSALTDIAAEKRVYDDMLASYASMFLGMQLAGMGVAFAIITNTASISLSERKREYATLRVLGMHPREIGRITAFEYWLLAGVGMLMGMPLTRLIKTGLSQVIDPDLFSMPVDTAWPSFLTAAAGCMAAVYFSNRMTTRHIAKLDMVDVLKERE